MKTLARDGHYIEVCSFAMPFLFEGSRLPEGFMVERIDVFDTVLGHRSTFQVLYQIYLFLTMDS